MGRICTVSSVFFVVVGGAKRSLLSVVVGLLWMLPLSQEVSSTTIPAKASIARGARLFLCSSKKEGSLTFAVTSLQKSIGSADSIAIVALAAVAAVVVDFSTVISRGAKKAAVASIVVCFELNLSFSANGWAKCSLKRASSSMDSKVVFDTIPLVFLLFQHNE